MAETNSLLNCRTRLGYRGFESPLLRNFYSGRQTAFFINTVLMFDFEKLEVYQLVKEQTNLVFKQIAKTEGLDSLIRDSWKNASLQVLLQLVQASGRVSTSEKKSLLTAARGYVFECSAILDLLKASGEVDAEKFEELYNNYERISKMLLGMFRSYESKVD